jgi:hypothetical protein
VDWWSVSVEARGDVTSDTDGNGQIAVSAMGIFTDLAQPYDGSIVADTERSRWTATLSIEAAGAPEAVAEAVRLVTTLAADAGLPGWPVVRTTAVRQDILEDLANPDRPIQ